MSGRNTNLPLVYSCSGCSSAAQMANYVAVELDRAEVAEMSCIAGVGGNVAHLVRIARSGRPILALDGCPLQCVKNSLAQRGVAPTRHILLHEHGVKKRYRTQFDMDDAKRLLKAATEVARDLAQGPAPDPAEAVAPGSHRDEGAPPMKAALRLRPPQH
ncbi:MAG: putative zinc-binding protein [Rhodocyclaceae bacterium]|nr:putative zinc-binding protein [Rhodocyclaceae bacterium]